MRQLTEMPEDDPRPQPEPDLEQGLAILAQLAEATQSTSTPASDRPSEALLHVAEARYRALVEQIPAVTFMATLDSGLNEVYVSPQIEGLLGFAQEEWMSNPVLWFRQLHPDDMELWNQEFARGCSTGGPFRAECRFIARDGSVVWVHGEARLIRDEHGRPVLLQGVAFDITESKRAEEIVKASLREKEMLLKEIHHRVKNNLQITSSLLRLQAARIPVTEAQQFLRESQDRIRSMALVHEMLYRSHDLARVDFGEYARSLVQQLLRSYGADARRVKHIIDVEHILLGVDEAVPCGLMINELVANSLKHAFPANRAGTIWVRMEADDRRCRLRVGDDGVGFPEGVDFRQTQTLGLQLVRTLTDQLAGTISSSREGGTEFTISFPRLPGVA
jgi:PAS domain S-box-containing protein